MSVVVRSIQVTIVSLSSSRGAFVATSGGAAHRAEQVWRMSRGRCRLCADVLRLKFDFYSRGAESSDDRSQHLTNDLHVCFPGSSTTCISAIALRGADNDGAP